MGEMLAAPQRFYTLACAFAVCATVAFAQADLSVRGTVTDSSGAIVPGVSIQLQTAGGASIATARSDSLGRFTLFNAPAGAFTLVVPATAGFAAQRRPLQLRSSVSGLRISLALESVSASVTVGANSSANSALSTDASANKDAVALSGSELEKLPVFDQDYIAALTPFLDPASGDSGGITIVVDGVEMKSAGVSPSAIQEIRINNDPYSVESNRPGRGRIEIMTKPGSPQFHGEGNLLIRDSIFNAKNYFAPVKPTEHRRIYEGNLTGPAGRWRRSTFLVTGSRREDDLAAAIHAVGPAGLIAETFPTTLRNTEFTGRVAHDRSDAHRLSVQYNFAYATTVDTNVGGIVLPEAGLSQDSREDDLVLNDRYIATPNLLNQLQITFEKDEDVYRSDNNAPSIQVKDSFTGGGAQADLARTENTIHVNDVVSWTHGRQYIRFGVQLPQFSRRALDDHTNRLGTFNFASLANYGSATPYVFTAQQGVGRGLYWINELGAFFEDQIKLTSHLQVSLGVRYEWQTYLSDYNNFAPRFSVAYALPGDPKTVLRAGAGVFYDRTGGGLPGTAKVHNGTVLRTFQVLNPGYPSALPSGFPIASLPTSLVRFDLNIHTPSTYQYSVDIERQLGAKLTVTAGYRGLVGVGLFRSRDVNAPLGPFYLGRPDGNLGLVQQMESHGRGMLNSFDVSVQGRAGRWFSGRAQYTLARNDNNTGGILFFPQNQYDPAAEWGRADTDRLQRFNLIGNINPDHWLTLGVAATLYSGSPYTETTGGDAFHTGLGNTRPAGVGRNTLETGGTADLDLIWDHDFHLSGKDKGRVLTPSISVFDVLNRTNYTSYVGSVSSPLFRQPTASLAPRQMQFSLRYSF